MATLINNIIDLNATQGEINSLLEQIRAIAKEIKSVKPLSLNVTGGSSSAEMVELTNAIKAQGAEIKRLQEAWAQAIKQKRTYDTDALAARQAEKQAAAEAKSIAAEKRRQDAESAKALKEYIKSVRDGQKELERLAKEQQKLKEKEANRINNDAEKKRLREEAAALREFQKQQKEMQRQANDAAKEIARQAKEADKLTNAYYRLDKEHQKLFKEAQRLGAELGIESKEFKDAAKAANELGAKLGQIDSALGNHRRNVGNYASAFNGLNNSINQITREFPAFVNSVQTGFIAISNNLPIFFDEIQRINTELKEFKLAQEAAAVAAGVQAKESALLAGETEEVASALGEMATEQARAAAEGVKGKGVLKQLASAVFSWQTLLSVGVTLLTVYGAKLVEWVFQQTKAERIAEERAQTEKELLEIEQQAYVSAGRQIARVTLLSETISNGNLSLKRRKEAYKELLDDYPTYLANITEEEALQGKLAATINDKVIPAIIAAARVRANEDKLSKLAAKAAETQNKLQEDRAKLAEVDPSKGYGALIDNYTAQNKEATKANQQINQATAKKVSEDQALQQTIIKGLANSVREGEEDLARTMAMMDEILGKNRSIMYDAGNLDPDSLTEKNAKDRTKAVTDMTNAEIKANDDILKSDLELYRAQVELEMARQKNIYENEELGLQERLTAYREYMGLRGSLIYAETDAEKKALQARLDEIDKIEKISVDKRTTTQKKLLANRKNYVEQLRNLEDRVSFEVETADTEGVKGQNDIIENDLKNRLSTFERYWQTITEREKTVANERIAQEREALERGEINERTYNLRRQQIINDSANRINEVLGSELQATIDYFSNQLNDPNLPEETRRAAEAIVNAAKTEFSKLRDARVTGRQQPSIMNLLGFGSDPNATPEQVQEQAKREIANLIQGLYQTLFTAIDTARQNYWENQFNALDAEAERIKRNAEIEKQAINGTLKSQEEKAALLQEIDNRTLAAERANDEKRKQYQRQQAQAEKRDALFKAGLEGSIAIAKAFSTYPYPASLAIAGLVAAQTAANIALIASRPIPQYKMGTDNHRGGLAIVGDGGKHEVIQEPNKHPFLSPDTATMMPLAKGTKVYKDVNTYIQKRAINNYAQYAAKNDANMTMAIAEFIADNFDKTGNKFVGAIKKMPRVSSSNGRDTFESSQGRTEYINRMRGL